MTPLLTPFFVLLAILVAFLPTAARSQTPSPTPLVTPCDPSRIELDKQHDFCLYLGPIQNWNTTNTSYRRWVFRVKVDQNMAVLRVQGCEYGSSTIEPPFLTPLTRAPNAPQLLKRPRPPSSSLARLLQTRTLILWRHRSPRAF